MNHGKRKAAMRTSLGHPLRIRIVAACRGRERTAKELAARFGVSIVALNKHLRPLVKGKYLTYHVEGVRGARRYVFTAVRRALITDEEFAQMTMGQRRKATEGVIRDLFSQMWAAWEKGVLDGRDDSHLTWNQIDLDEVGWQELMGVLLVAYEESAEIEKGARDRLRKSGATAIPTVIALGGFEGLPLKPAESTKRPRRGHKRTSHASAAPSDAARTDGTQGNERG